MELLSILVLALGLSMDATAVSIARAAAADRAGWREAATAAAWFGAFHAAMPLIGYLIGAQLERVVEEWDHWIACALLSGIGLKMLRDGVRGGPEREAQGSFGARAMALLALATSIDALATGITLAAFDAPVGLSIAVLASTAALLSGVGVLAGRRLGSAVGGRLEAIGGIVLIGLGIKIAVEHTVGS